MFPEWPRKDIAGTQRIYDLHVSIAQVEPAHRCGNRADHTAANVVPRGCDLSTAARRHARLQAAWHHGLPFTPEAFMNLQIMMGPLLSLIAGILILIVPRLLNYIVAIYLIIVGLVGLFGSRMFS